MTHDPIDAFGETSFETIASVVEVEESGWAVDRVQAAMARLNAVSEEAPYRAVVLWLRTATAFTLPGRYLYVGRELLSRGLSEEGVAFVLAHEMAHHALGHFASFERALTSGDEPALTKVSRWLQEIGQRAVRHLPDDEVEADAWALHLCASAGYDERGALELFDLARRVALDYRALDSVFGDGESVGGLDAVVTRLAGCGPTHPAIDARREAARRWADPNERSEPSTYPPASAGLTSTTMVCACAECAIRFAPLSRCPRCDTSAVYDLREPKARMELVRRLYRSTGSSRDRRHIIGGGAAVTASGGVVAYLLAFGGGLGDALAGGLLALVSGVALYGLVGGLARLIADERRGERVGDEISRAAHLCPVPLSLAGEGAPVVVDGVGVVRVLRSVTAPVSGQRCAAYRVVGEGPSGVIDDAEIGELEIVGPWGRARVDGAALIGLTVDDLPQPTPVGPALETFLRARGVLPNDAVPNLAEACLLEGEPVSVRGAGEARLVARGLRTEEQAWFLTWPEIERAERALRTGDVHAIEATTARDEDSRER